MTMVERLSRALRLWFARRRLYSAIPDLRDLDAAIAERRRQHRTVVPLMLRKRALLHAALKREAGR